MKARQIGVTGALVALIFSAAACEQGPPPCSTLPPPTSAEQEAAKGGVEVEREVGTTECVVVGNTWQEEEAE